MSVVLRCPIESLSRWHTSLSQKFYNFFILSIQEASTSQQIFLFQWTFLYITKTVPNSQIFVKIFEPRAGFEPARVSFADWYVTTSPSGRVVETTRIELVLTSRLFRPALYQLSYISIKIVVERNRILCITSLVRPLKATFSRHSYPFRCFTTLTLDESARYILLVTTILSGRQDSNLHLPGSWPGRLKNTISVLPVIFVSGTGLKPMSWESESHILFNWTNRTVVLPEGFKPSNRLIRSEVCYSVTPREHIVRRS